jgi:hypothetical protein
MVTSVQVVGEGTASNGRELCTPPAALQVGLGYAPAVDLQPAHGAYFLGMRVEIAVNMSVSPNAEGATAPGYPGAAPGGSAVKGHLLRTAAYFIRCMTVTWPCQVALSRSEWTKPLSWHHRGRPPLVCGALEV